jgi:hypothetical protein
MKPSQMMDILCGAVGVGRNHLVHTLFPSAHVDHMLDYLAGGVVRRIGCLENPDIMLGTFARFRRVHVHSNPLAMLTPSSDLGILDLGTLRGNESHRPNFAFAPTAGGELQRLSLGGELCAFCMSVLAARYAEPLTEGARHLFVVHREVEVGGVHFGNHEGCGAALLPAHGKGLLLVLRDAFAAGHDSTLETRHHNGGGAGLSTGFGNTGTLRGHGEHEVVFLSVPVEEEMCGVVGGAMRVGVPA